MILGKLGSDNYSAVCSECKRIFDLNDELEADEWYAGHDCEVDYSDEDDYAGAALSQALQAYVRAQLKEQGVL
jgi:hypothetical protein